MAVVEVGLVAMRGADSCTLCAQHATPRPAADTESDDQRPAWGVLLTVAVVIAALLGASVERLFLVGALAGICAAAACAWITLSALLARSRVAHERELARFAAESDERVAMVIRQFEWAVNDVVKQRHEIERAEASADLLVAQTRERERYVHRLEHELFEARERVIALSGTPVAKPFIAPDPLTDAMAGVIPFRWSLHNDRYQVNLELECGITSRRPTRVRLIDRSGNVLMTSGTPMWSDDGRPSFTLAKPPTDLVVDLDAGRDIAYRFQALADYEWREVRLEDSGRRTKIVTDKQGRIYRVEDAPDAAQLLVPPHSTLN